MFGGIGGGTEVYSSKTLVLTLDLQDFDRSKLELLRNKETGEPEKLPCDDRFYFNQYFPLKGRSGEDTCPLSEKFVEKYVAENKRNILRVENNKKNAELVGIVGRQAFHVFDKTTRSWVCSCPSLAYR